ncbi:hypothetical protein ACQKOE_14020 [Novosphingobium sp. NPDC080210]|uniref:hypothetical protein n=1 Tax=Novosphingobium sp. NPDC080210 TaxID=3390596 RepID=UPI003CFEBB28
MTDQAEIMARARELAIAHFKPSLVRERAFRNGAYDQGTDVTRFIPQAEAELIRDRQENTEVE